jgi:hypothetical protein
MDLLEEFEKNPWSKHGGNFSIFLRKKYFSKREILPSIFIFLHFDEILHPKRH